MAAPRAKDGRRKARKSEPASGIRVLDTQHLPQLKRGNGGRHPTCWRCGVRLVVGEPYYTRPGRNRKYYHETCWRAVAVSDSSTAEAAERDEGET